MNYFALEFEIGGLLLLLSVVIVLWRVSDLLKAKAESIATNTQLEQKRSRMGPYAPKTPPGTLSKIEGDED